LKFHPDRQDNEESKELANKKMLDINEAYGVLKDAEKKKKYDMVGVKGANMNFPSSDFGGSSGFNKGGNGGQKFKFSSSNGDIPPQFYNMFFENGSNNTFNFGDDPKNGKKKGTRGFSGDDDFFSDNNVFGDFGGFGDSDFGSFRSSNFAKNSSGPQSQKFKFSSKKR